MKTVFDSSIKLFMVFLLAITVWSTVFNGDVNSAKDKLLNRMPGLATSAAVLLPTAQVATRVPVIRTPAPIVITDNGEIVDDQLPDCATAPTTTACQLKGPTPVVPTPTVYMGTKPVFDTGEDPETGEPAPTDPPLEPVLAEQSAPVSMVLSTTADYRSDCHAMFASHEDKSGWAADIAKCESTGDYR